MVLGSRFFHSDGDSDSASKHKGVGLRAKLSAMASNRISPVRVMAVTLGMLGSAYMSPAMADLICEVVYATDQTGSIYAVGDDGTLTLEYAVAVAGANPFGITANATRGYLAKQISDSPSPYNAGAVVTFDGSTGETITTSPAPVPMPGQGDYLAGAVNPSNNWFYMASPNSAEDDATGWHLYAYDPNRAAVAPIYIGQITGTSGNNGDIAFDSFGNLFLLSGDTTSDPNNQIYRVGQVPNQAGSVDLQATAMLIEIEDESPASDAVGIAFNRAGNLVVSTRNGALYWFDPSTEALLTQAAANPDDVQITDLASVIPCGPGNSTITLVKDLPRGRALQTDQFMLQLSGGGLAQPQTATTTGSSSGVQTQVVGPLTTTAGATFTVNEQTADPTTHFEYYSRSWQCIDEANGNISVGRGSNFPGEITIPPAPEKGIAASVVCTITNSNQGIPQLTLSKTSDPEPGTPVQIGQTIIYTLTLNVNDATTLGPVQLVDTRDPGLSFLRVIDLGLFSNPSNDGRTFILPTRQSSGPYTLSYAVRVNEDAAMSVNNLVYGLGGGGPLGDPKCVQPGACETSHPIIPGQFTPPGGATPVPLGSAGWNALLVGLLAMFAMLAMGAQRRTH